MIKICKECGKEFEATSARQQYCSGPHFRPCPVCGKLVEIKYLSDPTPKCVDCRKHRSVSDSKKNDTPNVHKDKPTEVETPVSNTVIEPATQPEAAKEAESKEPNNSAIEDAEVSEDSILGEYVVRRYVGRNSAGFQTNHIYTVCLNANPPYGFSVHAILDKTTDDDIDKHFLLSSMNSWRYFFKEVED